jgi:hypothetical protein
MCTLIPTHATLANRPKYIAGISFIQEGHGFTGIYWRDPEGGLYFCRTVDQSDPKRHADVIRAWLASPELAREARESAIVGCNCARAVGADHDRCGLGGACRGRCEMYIDI